jgi:DNA invertase Pin-like site-specific DNA recombinase
MTAPENISRDPVVGVPKNVGLLGQLKLSPLATSWAAVIVLFTHPTNQRTINTMRSGQNKTNVTTRTIGYARVSTSDQELHLQLDALKQHGCREEHIFVDRTSGMKAERPGLTACLETLRAGDVLLVWRLDRLGRSMPHLVTLVRDLRQHGVGFRSICDGAIDTTTASGELVFNIFSALAQFEQRLVQERTRAGLCAARARGRKGGRPQLDVHHPRVQTAKALYQDKRLAIKDICRTLHIARSTLYRYLAMPE